MGLPFVLMVEENVDGWFRAWEELVTAFHRTVGWVRDRTVRASSRLVS